MFDYKSICKGSIFLLFLSCCAVFFCCQKKENEAANRVEAAQIAALPLGDSIPLYWARGFEVSRFATHTQIRLVSERETTTYLLYDKRKPALLDSLQKLQPQAICVAIPIERAILRTTKYLAFFEALGALENVVGLAGTQFVHSQNAQNAIQNQKISEIGSPDGLMLDLEKVVALQSEVIFSYATLEGQANDTHQKLVQLGQRVILAQETTEAHPLGQAEWLKFFAYFLGKEKQADSIFQQIEKKYSALKEKVKTVQYRPKVLLNVPYQEVWYMPAGAHFSAQFIADAGGDYLFSDLEGSGSIPLSIEKVYARGLQADLWLNPSNLRSLVALAQADKRFTQLPAFAKGRVFNATRRQHANSGNDIFEQGVLRPDLILEDLIHILQPQLLPQKDSLYFYEALE
ncbi:ABC transporter substrate-binding protein [Hugenholtzia roseola]|uniref:ABC transporter substrate-binding protein n=1 Tax=Hugenholtzia roseola TaxID=1002 RepID=UPI000427C5CA|nr:ABC transporter substrate-binding protein [Hugenholtzia roseola]